MENLKLRNRVGQKHFDANFCTMNKTYETNVNLTRRVISQLQFSIVWTLLLRDLPVMKFLNLWLAVKYIFF